MQLISSYVDAKIRSIGREILDGKIAANPYEKGNEEACTYCAYKKVCGFDGSIPGYEKRQLEDLDKQALMQRMQKTWKLRAKGARRECVPDRSSKRSTRCPEEQDGNRRKETGTEVAYGNEFYPEQQKVIELHNSNILVSAAAGSGKTAVLVERRIIRMICEGSIRRTLTAC